MHEIVCGLFYARKENNMKYNIALTHDELDYIILGLDSVFRDCCEHRDLLNGFDDESELEKLNDAVEVGTLLQRFLDLYNHAE